MRILTDTDIEKNLSISVALGNFDGVHLGHQLLLEYTKRLAGKLGAIPAVCTFKPHPERFYGKRTPLICTMEQKMELLERYGAEVCFLTAFNKAFSELSPEEFMQKHIIERMNAKAVVVGSDFRFAKNREGDAQMLKKFCDSRKVECEVVQRLTEGGEPISSTRVRERLAEGRVDIIPDLLGRYISFSGVIVRGDRIGSTIGFPTANLQLENELLPPDGVYAGYTFVSGKMYAAMSYLGTRPTVSNANERRFEVNIIDYEGGDMYGKKLEVFLTKQIRGGQKFSGLEELKEQLTLDKQSTLAWMEQSGIRG